jgi:NTE family protein
MEPNIDSQVPNEFIAAVLNQLPTGLRAQGTHIAQRLLPGQSLAPAYFDVLTNSVNIMQDYVTRARLAGRPPHMMLPHAFATSV